MSIKLISFLIVFFGLNAFAVQPESNSTSDAKKRDCVSTLKVFEISHRSDFTFKYEDYLTFSIVEAEKQLSPNEPKFEVQKIAVMSDGNLRLIYANNSGISVNIRTLIQELTDKVILVQSQINGISKLVDAIENHHPVTLIEIINSISLKEAKSYGITDSGYWKTGDTLVDDLGQLHSTASTILMKLRHLGSERRDTLSFSVSLISYLQYNVGVIANINSNIARVSKRSPSEPTQIQAQ